MDLDQLHTFLEIVRLKSFSKAAQTCFRTQPAISAQIRQLEQELNTQLFDRFGSRISLTTAGKVFCEYAEQILDLRRRAQEAIYELEGTPRGALVIAANEAACIYILPRVFAEYARQFPNVQIVLERSYGTRVIETVLENAADFGVAPLPVSDRKLQAVQIHSDEIKLIVPGKHELAARDAVRAADLEGQPLLLPKYGTTRVRVNEWLQSLEDEQTVRVAMELDSTEMIKRFVAAGLGISFMAESNCLEEIAAGRLRAVPLAPEPMLRKLGLVYRKDKALSRAALGFIEAVLAHAGPERAGQAATTG
jgi:DNA-binding transcriptional LysR family regulator